MQIETNKIKLKGLVHALAPFAPCPYCSGAGYKACGRFGVFYKCGNCHRSFRTDRAKSVNKKAKEKQARHLKEVSDVQKAEVEANKLRARFKNA